MKDTTAISLLLALALATLTVSSTCENPGSIGSKGECVSFCQVNEISYGGGICQCLGSSMGGLWSPYGECICPGPGGRDCLPEGSDDRHKQSTTAPIPSSTPAAPSIPVSSSSATCTNKCERCVHFVQGWESVLTESVNGRQSCVATKATGYISTSGGTATVNGKIFNAPFAPCPGASSMSSASEHGVGLAAVAAGIGVAAIF
ncbi:hypothetical protein THAOC_13673, partial [Thalassiosira oceanica]